MKHLVYFATGAAIGAGCAWLLKPQARIMKGEDRVVSDTVIVTRTDTVTLRAPAPRASAPVRVDTVWLPLVGKQDTASASVAVPIEQTHYAHAEYDAWVSGFRARLDSITLRQSHSTSTVTVTRRVPAPRWGLSVTAGAAVTPAGIQPAITVGISYTLWHP